MFLGNGGSMLLGYAVTWFLIELSQQPHRAIAPVTALWILAVPLVDAVGSMLRRIANGRSPFAADRQHLHHAFLAAGYTVERTVLTLIGVAALLAAVGWGAERVGVPAHLMFVAFLVLSAAYYWRMQQVWGSDAERSTSGAEATPSTFNNDL